MPSPLTTGYFDANAHQGHHGEAFVHLLAAAAGLNVARYDLDVGVDWILATPGPRGTQRSPKIEVQVKSWSTPTGSAAVWNFPLSCRAYNHLAGPGHEVPHFLFVCVVPTDAALYADADHEQMLVRKAAYWHSLANETPDPTLNPESTKTVHIPKCNLLTPATVTALVERRLGEAVV